MRNLILFAVTLGLAAAVSLPAQEGRERQEQQQRERQDNHAQYHFRQEDAGKLRQHYKNISRDMKNRGHFVAGERLPNDWRHRMHPVPQAVVAELPPPPPGYVFGYIDGYCVVYDPNTGYIADVIDLANLP